MFDFIRENVKPDLGMCFAYPTNNLSDVQFKSAVNSGDGNWMSRIESLKNTVIDKIETINNAYTEMAK